MNNLLLILSCKRHEMLNQLQIVSGYLQLDKPEKAREYLTQMAQELTWESTLCNCKSEKVATALLTTQCRLNLAGVKLQIRVQADLSSSCIPDDQMAEIIEGLGEQAKAYLQDNPVSLSIDWGLEVIGRPEGTQWKFILPCEKPWLENLSHGLKQRLQEIGGGRQCTISCEETGLVLYVPKESKL